MAVSETPTAQGTCPTDEDLAAFLDGMLPEPERARIIAHLADCETCYEIFADAAHFLHPPEPEEAGKVLGFPGAPPTDPPRQEERRSARKLWWIAPAAAAVLAVGIGLGWYRYQSQPKMEVTGLIAPVESKPEILNSLHHFTTYRGEGDDQVLPALQKPSFLVGARLVDLRLLLAKGQKKEALELYHGIGVEIQRATIIGQDETAKRYIDLTQSGNTSELPPWEEEFKDSSLDTDFLDFGKWVEAGRLAAESRAAGFFDSGKNRRFLSAILRKMEKEQPPEGGDAKTTENSAADDEWTADAERDKEVLAQLRQIATVWDRDDRGAAEYQKLAASFRAILQSYDV
jgi:hypothetical protein